MAPLDFLAVVLPSPGHGYYCTAELTTKKKEHVYVENIGDTEGTTTAWHTTNCDVYFALATFTKKDSREATNASFIKSLFIDMDGYVSKKAAALALRGFLQQTGLDSLGDPWLVGSGGGIHCYWPFNDSVDIATWKPVAESFKRLCKQEGLSIDMTVTADAARVLRIPGTTNFKKKYDKPRAVTLLTEGNVFEFADIATAISGQLKTAYVPPVVAEVIPGSRPKRALNATSLKLFENSTTSFAEILDRTEAGTGCAQLTNYIANATEDGIEPIWRGLLSWAKVCDDGEDYATWLSSLHPYEESRMRQKMNDIKGPYPCVKMDSENPGLCTGCSHWGKITNPLAFGRKLKADNTAKQIPVVAALEEDDEDDGSTEGEHVNVAVVTRPPPPRGFSYGANGGVYCEKKDKDGEGREIKKQVQILAYDLFVVDILKQENDHLVHMATNRLEGVTTLNFPQRAIVSQDETLKWLAAQNIIASFGKGNHKNLYDYVLACVEEASLSKKAIVVPLRCGWQEDKSFVYNNRVFFKKGGETTIPMPGLENINRSTNSKGTLDEWRKVWNVFIQKKMHTLVAMCVDTFGCALMPFTDYEGFVWHIGSRQSGTGKSLALSAKAGVWGHPLRYRTSKGTSPVAMQQRAGLLGNMPLLIDEITSKGRNDMEWAPGFIFDVTEGQGKERMESGSNKERINNSTWALTCTMTSNIHLTDYMSGARQFSSNGELMRMLEWTPDVELTWTTEEREILKGLKKNYGVAGEAWVRWITTNQETVQAVVQSTHLHLLNMMQFTDQERYWHAGCTTTVAAAILLGGKYSGIINIPVKATIDALMVLVEKARVAINSNIRTADDVLNAYTRDNYGSFVIIKKSDGRILSSWGNGETVDKSTTRSKVLGRVEHGITSRGYVEYYLEEQILKQHCVAMSFSYADFKGQLEKLYRITYVKKNMLADTNGPALRVNVMHISRKADEITEDQLPLGIVEAG